MIKNECIEDRQLCHHCEVKHRDSPHEEKRREAWSGEKSGVNLDDVFCKENDRVQAVHVDISLIC